MKPCDQNEVVKPTYIAANIEDIKVVCREILSDHNEYRATTTRGRCFCEACAVARRLLMEVK